VRAFARQKAKVGFIDISEKPAAALVAELTAQGAVVHFDRCDVTDCYALRDSIGRLRGKTGPIDVLVNNAAHDERHETAKVTPEYWDDRIAVNVKHQFFAAQAVLPDMQAAKAGSIVNFGSVSWMIGQGGMAVYTTAKSAVLGLTRSLARDYGADNIRVNAIAPGWIMTERQIEKWLTPESEAKLLEAQCLKRKLVPDDIAKFVMFLASDDAGACTNQHYIVDGGWV
jgi:NAD(P)-dependent dehydrogenase (short-subunit alcohol dehydrogenase family)